MSKDDDRELPSGWIKDFDEGHKHAFYVDTNAKPPRSIWLHPLDDPQYQREQEEKKRDRPKSVSGFSSPPDPPPNRPSSYHGSDSNLKELKDGDKGKRGFFGKLKDKAIGTKEEREAARAAEQRAIEEQRRAYYNSRPQGYGNACAGPSYGPPQGQYYAQPVQQGYYAPQYGPPPQPYAYAAPQQQRGLGGFGGGGAALPLLGGLAGGLLLGSALDGGFDGGGFDGGGFDGGFF